MRIIEYETRKLCNNCYIVANAMTDPDPAGIAAEHNVRSPGIKFTVVEQNRQHKREIADYAKLYGEAKNNPDFCKKFRSALRGEDSDWKIIAFQPIPEGVRIFLANEELYDAYLDYNPRQSESEPPDYEEAIDIFYADSGIVTLLFEVKSPGRFKPDPYYVEISCGCVKITEYDFNKKRELSFTGRITQDGYYKTEMYVQETEYIL